MKILLITGIYPPDIGGPATYIPELANYLTNQGHKVRILTLAENVKKSKDELTHVIRVQRKMVKIPRMLITIWKIIWTPSDYKIFANGLHEEVGLSLFLRNRYAIAKIVGDPVWERSRNKNVTSKSIKGFNESRLPTQSYIERVLLRYSLNRFQAITCPSEDLCKIVESWGVTKPIKFIANGVLVRDAIPISQKEYDLICVSRLVSWKNIKKHIEIASQLDLKIAIVGSGPEESELMALAKSLGCNATFFGETSKIKIEELLNSSKVFILLSEYEGLSFSLLEAMSFGLPAIVSDIEANSSVVRDEIDGLVINADNWQSSKLQILKLFSDENYYKKISLNAQNRISKEFNAVTQFAKVEKLLSNEQ